MKNFIVTGASGFVGKALVKKLAEQGCNVIELHHNDNLTDFAAKYSATKIDCFYINGWGGTSGPSRVSLDCQLGNINYVKDILELILKLQVKKIFFASSIAEFEFIKAIFKEKSLPSIALYGSSKLYAHSIVRNFCENNGIDSCFGVFSCVYGPGELNGKLVPSSIQKLIKDEKLTFSKGDKLFDFIYIDDLVEDLFKIGTDPSIKGHYLIGSGKYKPLRLWLEEMCEVFGKNTDDYRIFGDIPASESLDLSEFHWMKLEFLSNVTNAKRTPFVQGIKNTAYYIKECLKGQ